LKYYNYNENLESDNKYLKRLNSALVILDLIKHNIAELGNY